MRFSFPVLLKDGEDASNLYFSAKCSMEYSLVGELNLLPKFFGKRS